MRLLQLILVATPAFSQQLALVGGTIYADPAQPPIPDGVIVIDNGRISALGRKSAVPIPKTARTIDCKNTTITAGFWNSHVHFFELKWENAATLPAAELARQLEDMTTRFGFTTVFDLGSKGQNTRAIRTRIESGEVSGPRIFTTGEALLAPGAMPPANVLRFLGNMYNPGPEVATPVQAAEASQKLIAEGADAIKVHLQRRIPEDAIRAAVAEAHRANKPVFVHPSDTADILASLRAGVDIIAHTTPYSPWDDKTVKTMKDANVPLIPTLTVWKHIMRHGRVSAQQSAVATATAELKSWHTANGTTLFGNDLGAVEYDPTEEYVLMSKAGMTFPQILASLTTNPAKQFHRENDLGKLAKGMIADIVVLSANPAKDIRALANVRYTFRSGKLVSGAGPV